MNVTITPKKLAGVVVPPASKSVAHRCLLAGFLGKETSKILGISPSEDMEATCRCGLALGATVETEGETVTITGGTSPEKPIFDCGESGSTLRFLIPIAAVLCGGGTFTGRGRLMERPQKPYAELFASKNLKFIQKDGKITVDGWLKGGRYEISGDVSSQFITGLLFALPLCKEDSDLVLTTPLESAGYVDITLDVLKQFGIEITAFNGSYHIKGNQTYKSIEIEVERDFSQSAFFYVANALGNAIEVAGMNPNSVQGDRAMEDIIATILREDAPVIDMRQVPDLMPVTTVLAALQPGKTTEIVGAKRLRIKESDRIATTVAGLVALGGKVIPKEDGVTVYGQETLSGGVVDCANDHRIAMAMAVASTCATGTVSLEGAECVKKSYPTFWEDFRHLGGNFT